MKCIFVAGPFRAKTQWDIECNVRVAEEHGLMIAKCGVMPFIPQANTKLFHGQLDEQFWLEGTQEFVRRCDALIAIPGWEDSEGTLGEIALAEQLGMPVLKLPRADNLETASIIREFVRFYRLAE